MIRKIIISLLFLMIIIVVIGNVSAANTTTPISLSKATPRPDLVVSSVSTPNQALRGHTIIIRNTVKNQGTGTSGSFLTSFYLKSSTGSYKLLGCRAISLLAPGQTNTHNSILTIPYTMPEGNYKITIITDSGRRIAESNELNNKITTTKNTLIIDPVRKPSTRMKLIFIHHSCGSNWLNDGLGRNLNLNNYYVTESDYGWSAEPGDSIGDRTDTINWPEWFTYSKMRHVYASNFHSAYTNFISNPGGENKIIMFKSCFPNSEVGGSIGDEMAIYNRIKTYFAAHPERLFVLITPPGETNVGSYRLTRQLCNWLVDKKMGWLKGYKGKNVMVFDFYGVLSEVNSHHRWINNHVEHVYATNYDGNSPYHNADDHPNTLGNQKATVEFIKLLNYAYNLWKT